MAITIETVHKELVGLKKDIEFIKHALSEDFELSDEARKALKAARETPESEYVDLK